MIESRLTKSPKVGVMKPTGGEAGRGRACGATSHHGFLGVEDEVVGRIAEWIKARVKP